jgi:hypothetical protein
MNQRSESAPCTLSLCVSREESMRNNKRYAASTDRDSLCMSSPAIRRKQHDEDDRSTMAMVVVGGSGVAAEQNMLHSTLSTPNLALTPVPASSPNSMAVVVPTTRNPYYWSHVIQDPNLVRHALQRMSLAEPTGCNEFITLPATPTALVPPHLYYGARGVSELLFRRITRPVAYAYNFAARLSDVKYGLNCTIVGPPGSGKRSIIQSVCATCQVRYLCISPSTYEKHHIWTAADMACEHKNTLIYFDEFDKLISNPIFYEEFTSRITKDKRFTTGWNNMWLVFGICKLEVESLRIVRELCAVSNVAFMEHPKPVELVNIAYKKFTDKALPLDPPLTDVQRNTFLNAAANATPGLMVQFAGRVILSALDNASYGQLSEDTAGMQEANPVYIKGNDTDSTVCDTVGANGNFTLPHRQTTPNAAIRASVTTSPTIQWDRDAEAHYVYVSASDSTNGVDYPVICEAPGEIGDPSCPIGYVTKHHWDAELRKTALMYLEYRDSPKQQQQQLLGSI